MGRKASEPKTDLGRRLRELRAELGANDLIAFADSIGIGKSALAYYERGERVPDASVLLAYREKVGVNLHWLLTGVGEMFDAISTPKTKHVPVSTDLMEKLARLAEQVHKDAGIKLPAAKLTSEAADLYNQLQAEVADLTDIEEIEANLPRLKLTLKRRLEQAKSNPGSGKQEASQ